MLALAGTGLLVGLADTLTVAVAVAPRYAAVMVAVPGLSPVRTPLLLIVETPASSVFHVAVA